MPGPRGGSGAGPSDAEETRTVEVNEMVLDAAAYVLEDDFDA
ncbi:hypothetical protein [Streptomyces cyaneofuscatus]